MESELLALAHRAASEGHEPGPSGAAPTAQREHARDWVLRRALVAADVLGCAAALLFVQLAFVNQPFSRPGRARADGRPAWPAGSCSRRSSACTSAGAPSARARPRTTSRRSSCSPPSPPGSGCSRSTPPGSRTRRSRTPRVFWVAAIAAVTVGARARPVRRCSISSHAREATLILGSGRVAGHIAAKLASRPVVRARRERLPRRRPGARGHGEPAVPRPDRRGSRRSSARTGSST